MAKRKTPDLAPTTLQVPEPVKLNGGHLAWGDKPRMVDRDYSDPFDSTGDGMGGNRGNRREHYLARKGLY